MDEKHIDTLLEKICSTDKEILLDLGDPMRVPLCNG
jgi:hypothetical protein